MLRLNLFLQKLSCDKILKQKFDGMKLAKFWILVKDDGRSGKEQVSIKDQRSKEMTVAVSSLETTDLETS